MFHPPLVMDIDMLSADLARLELVVEAEKFEVVYSIIFSTCP